MAVYISCINYQMHFWNPRSHKAKISQYETHSDNIDVCRCSSFFFSLISFSDRILVNSLGSPRPPFDDIIQRLVVLGNPNEKNQKLPVIVSVDIPSGWHVEEGDQSGKGIRPDLLVCIYDSEIYLSSADITNMFSSFHSLDRRLNHAKCV